MTFWRRLLPALFICPSLALPASKEMVELQRDVALLQEQVRTLQQSQNEKLAGLVVLVQQAVDASNRASTAVTLLQSGLRQTVKDQQKSVVEPVVGVGAKIDQMSTDFQALRESVADISSQVGKLQSQMVDIGNAVRTIQTPAAAPPGPGGGPGSPQAAGGIPPVPAETLDQNAMRDRR